MRAKTYFGGGGGVSNGEVNSGEGESGLVGFLWSVLGGLQTKGTIRKIEAHFEGKTSHFVVLGEKKQFWGFGRILAWLKIMILYLFFEKQKQKLDGK